MSVAPAVVPRLIVSQQRKGEDSEGFVIGLYSYRTQEINPLKQAGTPFTLHDSGKFQKSIYVDISTGSIDVYADADKTSVYGTVDIVDLYSNGGASIMELNSVNFELLKELIIELYEEYVSTLF